MKTALVYYSLDGNCALIARLIKEKTNADVFALELADEKKRRGLAKMIWGGRMVMTGRKPPLKALTVNPADYDLIILGTPVWAGTFAPPLLTFLAGTNITGKKIALFACYAGSAGKTFDRLKALLAGNEIAGTIGFKNPARLSRDRAGADLSAWLKTL
ncbi:MAG: NAD(P)H-dependent oxidoreductase [Treponema sp.]|jgi:flavodoxin|nr:NAD(P)H-dependent oxidoreductase [Treponema sp.]